MTGAWRDDGVIRWASNACVFLLLSVSVGCRPSWNKPRAALQTLDLALFCQDFDIIIFLFLFDKYCSIMK